MEARDLPCVGRAALTEREHSVAHALWERRARGREHAHLLRWDIELDSRRVRAVPRSPRHDPDGDHLLNLSLSLARGTRSSRSRSLRSLNRGPCPCARRSAFQSHSDSLRERLAHGFVHGDAEFVHLVVDRKSTRLNSSHVSISYAVFCLKKKKLINLSVTHLSTL